jgi:hypothetical protein
VPLYSLKIPAFSRQGIGGLARKRRALESRPLPRVDSAASLSRPARLARLASGDYQQRPTQQALEKRLQLSGRRPDDVL